MNILVNGPSPARGPGSWPYLIQQYYNANLVNLSQAGAGNDYIVDATISELTQRKYDLVLIMTADLRRVDVRVSNIDRFNDTIYTSKCQKIMNDWPEKQVSPINDQDYVDDNWVFGCGYINTKDPSIVSLFESYYANTDTNTQYFRSYCKILGLQGFLKSLKQPYMMCGTRHFTKLERFKSLYAALDFDCIVNDISIFEIAKNIDSWEPDGLHPGPQAHQLYSEHLIDQLTKRKILS
jgi:hypothetical protein